MLKFFTPDRQGKQEPYSYRARARLVGHCILQLSEAKQDDIVVIGRIHEKSHIDYLRKNNIRYIHDICDNKWPMLEHLWEHTNLYATAITTTCESLKELIHTKSQNAVYVIPDPTEREEEFARFQPGTIHPFKVKLVYYGSDVNYRQLDFSKYNFPNSDLTIVTNIKDNNIEQWSFENQGKWVRNADMIILPVDNNNPMAMYKGNNRPVDAIRMGRFVLTNAQIPSWLKLKEYMWVGDLEEGYKWAINNPNEVIKRIKSGQSFIEETYTTPIIKQKWEEIYNVCYTRNIG